MDHHAIANINADVADVAGAVGGIKQQIARLEVVHGNGVAVTVLGN